MTELSALAGSEGYAACDVEANVELSASGGQRGAERSAGLHRPLSRPGGPKLSEKAVRGLFRQGQALSIPTISHSALSLYMHS